MLLHKLYQTRYLLLGLMCPQSLILTINLKTYFLLHFSPFPGGCKLSFGFCVESSVTILSIVFPTSKIHFSGCTLMAQKQCSCRAAGRHLGRWHTCKKGRAQQTRDFSMARNQEAASSPQLAGPKPNTLLMEIRAWGHALVLPSSQFLPQVLVAVKNL